MEADCVDAAGACAPPPVVELPHASVILTAPVRCAGAAGAVAGAAAPALGGLLYLGGVQAAREAGPLERAGVTHVVDLTATGVDHQGVRHPGLQYLHINIQDLPREDLGATFAATGEFIRAAHAGGGGVLVHCHYGKSRSACTVMAYLVAHCGLSLQAAFDACKQHRPVVGPNPAFVKQASEWERKHCGGAITLDPVAYAVADLWQMVQGGLVQNANGLALSHGSCEAAVASCPVDGQLGSLGLVLAMCWLEEMADETLAGH